MTRKATRECERGAVAVVFAIVCLVLFATAAVAVDLGNAFTRKRDVQAQADMAALAGGSGLSSSDATVPPTDAVQRVREYLNANQPQDDKGAACVSTQTCVTDAQLTNDNLADGEVDMVSGALKVYSPYAEVDFGLANAIGFNRVDVQAVATVGLYSPGPVVPFFLPKDCAAGTVVLKASSYNPGAPTFNPPSGTGNSIAKVNSLDMTTVPGATATTITIAGENFTATSTVDFHLAGSSDRVPATLTDGHPATLTVDTTKNDEATTTLPPAVYNKPGTWYLRVNNGNGWSRDVGIFIVGNPTPPPSGCGQRATGDFGVIDSPRTAGPHPTNQLAEASALNMAIGIDHNIVPWPAVPGPPQPPEQDTCHGLGGPAVTGANNDVSPSQDGRNCLDVKNGMNTDTVTDGMITGVGTVKGRLDTGASICNKTGGTEAKERLGHQTNDDVLSCFLKPGITVGEVSGETIAESAKGSLSSAILDSPRFMVVPVIDYPVNPQNGFYPVVGMQPVFITDEPAPSSKGASYASSTNGLTISGNKLVQITVVAINAAALPEVVDSDGEVVPYYGSGPKIVRLID